ncbi:MAG TPA: PHP domain-containing protein, partial [Gemmatimonadaceae bacterium]|nr:PHP domain-containing protein [Gemmatimonadaceae bacterium]
VELHAHSAFSLLDGASAPEELIARAVVTGQVAIALTDHDELGGAVRFAQAATAAGIAGIIGAELTVQADGVLQHLTLLATSRIGYGNLSTLLTRARMDAVERGAPSVPFALLAGHAAGLHALSGCPRGAVPQALAAGNVDEATRIAGTLRDLFTDGFAIEVWDHRLPEERALVRQLIPIARRIGVPWVVTNNVHYATRQGRPVHDALTALRHGRPLDAMGTRLRPSGEWYLKSTALHARRWLGHESGLRATRAIAEQCQFRIDQLKPSLPRFPLPPGVSEDDYLAQLVETGATERWGHTRTPQQEAQLAHELGMIRRLEMAGYFLIVWDIVRFSRREGILCQGRGSAANSAVCYCLGITAVDPIRMNLLFERFLSEERREPPDIDIDFAHRERERVLQYVYERYGREHAAMVCEQITYRGRSAVRDAARVLGFSLEQGDALAAVSDRFSARSTAAALRAGVGTATGDDLRRTAFLDNTPSTLGEYGPVRHADVTDAQRAHIKRDLAKKALVADAPASAASPTGARPATRTASADVDGFDGMNGDGTAGRPEFRKRLEREERLSAIVDITTARAGNSSGPAPSSDASDIAERLARIPAERTRRTTAAERAQVDAATAASVSGPVVPGVATQADATPPSSFTSTTPAPVRPNADPKKAPPSDILQRAGLDPADPRVRVLADVVDGLHQLPRHRSIHVGGFVLTREPLSSVVPIEPASMPGRTVIQWERDDLDAASLVKIDLLGLGMLTVLQDCLVYVRQTRGVTIDLALLDTSDQAVYDDLCAADTIGVFQVESRAQMNTLPRLKPRCFYDLVVEVALIRPGPIQGAMVHPYLRRRAGTEEVVYPHPSLEPILKRTLGVPLFQEQGMQVAIACAGFTPGEADTLRRAMGHKRSHERMEALRQKMLDGMRANGIDEDVANRIFAQINAFADYGFPESHAASFALLVYASAWLRHYYHAEFLAAMLNAQPMGFYAPGTLIEDGRRHGVEVRPVDLTRSAWDATLESRAPQSSAPAIRLGVRSVRGLGAAARGKLEAALTEGAFSDVPDVVRRTRLDRRALRLLAESGAFDGMFAKEPLATRRRRALWEVLAAVRGDAGPLAPSVMLPDAALPRMSMADLTEADYRVTGVSLNGHPMRHLRPLLQPNGIRTARDIQVNGRDTEQVAIAGLVICRQRPGTAKGFVFLSIEDETGIVNVVVSPQRFERDAL